MIEESRAPFWTGIRNGLRASFRISEEDRRARMGAFRRVVAMLTQTVAAAVVAWMFANSVGFLVQAESLLQKAEVCGLLFALLGLFLSIPFVRVEIGQNALRATHPVGRWGGWLTVAGIAIFFGSAAIRFLLAFGGS